MPWAHLDDHFYSHPKVVATPLPAVGLFAIGLSYCGDQLTDGFIPRSVVVGIRGWTSAARMLIERNFWNEVPGGYQVHDYLDWNDSREQVLAKRKGAADRAASSRERRRAAHVTEHVPRDVTRTSGIHATPLHSGVTEVTPGDPPNPLPAAAPDETPSRRGSQECPNCRRAFIGPYSEHHCAIQRPTRRPVLGKLLPREAREPPPPEVLAELEHLERTRADRQAEAARQMQA